MRQLIGIGKMAIYSIVAIVLLSSVVYADEGAKAVSVAEAYAYNGGDATSLVSTEVSIFPDGNGYRTTTVADVELEAIGNSDTYGYAYGEGTSPVDPDGEQANAGVYIEGNAWACNSCSSAGLSGIAVASASTEDLTAVTRSDLSTYAIGCADADGITHAWASIIE